jgi:ubiquinone biosynthesis protein
MRKRNHPPGNNPADGPRDSKGRLGEILRVLRKRDVLHGLTPEKLRLILEDMGPTFVKLGQLMSMRSDLLPAAYCEELTKLRAEVKPVPFEEVRRVLAAEFGRPVAAVFSAVDPVPLGAASIAQAHLAVLRGGERVVVKVQRPGVRAVMARDMVLLRRAVRILNAVSPAGEALDFGTILEEMWAAAQQEMDFLSEAANLRAFAELNREVAYVGCPRVISRLTTPRVLVMEYVEGVAVDDVDELRRRGYDLREIGEKLAENYAKQVLDDAFFHADPHPGNICVREGRIVWLDLGMMGRLNERDKSLLRSGVKAIAQNDIMALKNVLLTLGVVKGHINHTRLYTDLDDLLLRYGDLDLGSINLGQLVGELLELARGHNIAVPPGVTMLGRGVITMEGVLAVLSPEVSLLRIIRNHLSGEIWQELDAGRIGQRLARGLYGAATKGVEIPAQISDVLRMSAKGQLKLNVEHTGSEEPLGRLEAMTNRLVAGLITAALLIGSSIVCTTGMRPQILGIPALGAAGFLAAVLLGGGLLLRMVRRKKRK